MDLYFSQWYLSESECNELVHNSKSACKVLVSEPLHFFLIKDDTYFSSIMLNSET